MVKKVTANENEAISAYVQLQAQERERPGICDFESRIVGEFQRIVRIYSRRSRHEVVYYDVYVYQEGWGQWHTWKIVSACRRLQYGYWEEFPVFAWVATDRDDLGHTGIYRFALAPADVHIDANHDHYFQLASA